MVQVRKSPPVHAQQQNTKSVYNNSWPKKTIDLFDFIWLKNYLGFAGYLLYTFEVSKVHMDKDSMKTCEQAFYSE